MRLSAICIDDLANIDTWVKVAEYAQTRNVPTCFAVDTKNLDKLSSDTIKRFSDLGHEICSHTVSHLRDYRKLSDKRLHYELGESKKILEGIIEKPVRTIIWPHGCAGFRESKVAASLGYKVGRIVTVPGRSLDMMPINPFVLPGFPAGRLFGKDGSKIRKLSERITIFFDHGENSFTIRGWKKLIDFLFLNNIKPVSISEIGRRISNV